MLYLYSRGAKGEFVGNAPLAPHQIHLCTQITCYLVAKCMERVQNFAESNVYDSILQQLRNKNAYRLFAHHKSTYGNDPNLLAKVGIRKEKELHQKIWAC